MPTPARSSTRRPPGRGSKRRARPRAHTHAKQALSDEALELVAARFRALSDPSRLRLLNLLMQAECSVQELVEASGLGQTNVSRHLGLLRREGLVARVREGNRALYHIADPSVERLCAIVCGGLSAQRNDDLDALGGSGI